MDLSNEIHPHTKDFKPEALGQAQAFGVGVKKIINLHETYEVGVFGLGEIYEMMSVERIRKKLLQRHEDGILYLAPNKNHSQRGMTLHEMESWLTSSGYQVIEKGYADSPFWKSNPREKDNARNYSHFIIFIAKIIFLFIVQMEFLQAGPRHSHMIYCLTKRK